MQNSKLIEFIDEIAEKVKMQFSKTKEPDLYNWGDIYQLFKEMDIEAEEPDAENLIVEENGEKYLKPQHAKSFFREACIVFCAGIIVRFYSDETELVAEACQEISSIDVLCIMADHFSNAMVAS